MSWFEEGYAKVEQRAKEVEDALNKDYVAEFFLQSDQEATISFLTFEPFTYDRHFLQSTKKYYTCSKDGNCVLCASGNKASFCAAYLVVDHRYETWADKKTGEKKERQNTLKIANFGIRAAKSLAALHKKRGLDKFAWDVTRTGSGNDTTYTFLPSMDEDMQPVRKAEPNPPMNPKKTTKEILMETVAPKTRDALLKVLSGSGIAIGQQPQGGGQQQAPQQSQGTYNKPPQPNLDMMDDEQDPDTISWGQ